MPGGGCQDNNARRWMPGDGCQEMDARTIMPGDGCQDVGAWKRMKRNKLKFCLFLVKSTI